jgi:hypothetical protein
MARADAFPESAMQEVVAEAAEWLAASELPVADTRIKRPLSIWDIGAGTPLRDAATASGEWHHQIVHAGRGIAFGRSRLTGDRAELIELAQSPLTEALEDALRALRSSTDDSTILRLIRIQRNHTTCLWLYKPEGFDDGVDEVVTLQSPVWDRNLRIDETTFLRMVHALPGPGLVGSRGDRRRENVDPWDRRAWTRFRTRPVRQSARDL